MERILIGGTHSGVGKTTVTAGLLAALRHAGKTTAPFKVGPDYIDPGFHAMVSGMPAGNLDSWMLPPDQVLEVMARRVPPGSIAVIEGVMGLFDGRKNLGEVGSSAHVAKITRTPVLLVVSGAGTARSVAAMVGGYMNFDGDLRFAGVLFNYVSGEKHFRILKEAVTEHLGLPVFGYLPKNAQVAIPERHLGLLPAAEVTGVRTLLDKLGFLFGETVDTAAILEAAQCGPLPVPACTVFPDAVEKTCRIAVARDEAFHFYYHENLALLESYGAELVDFSPLADHRLPAGCSGVYIGGGFPEMFADRLSANTTLRGELSAAAADGMPVYAECGGYMYLSRQLVDFHGQSYPMAGIFPGSAVMKEKRQALGYVEVAAAQETFLFRPGERYRGHEFHWSDMKAVQGPSLYLKMPGGEPAGEVRQNCLGSYIHLHFLSNPSVAKRLVEACRAYAARTGGGRENHGR
jgi:cobyrinic acid a,c-diamide synthase